MWPYAAAADSSSIAENTTVTLDRSLHFFDPVGELVVVDPGSYVVEQAEFWLRLIAGERKDAILIEAMKIEHVEAIDAPVAVNLEDKRGGTHLVLLMPDGEGLEAIGSSGAIRSRGLMQAKLSPAQIKQAFTAKTLSAAHPFQSPSSPKPGLSVRPEATGGPSLQIQGSPPVPVLDQPAPNFSLTDSQISFRWHPSAGNPDQTRYELCVAETGAVCGSSVQSIVFKTIEAASQAGTAQYELGVGPTAVQQTPSTGTPITAIRYDVHLPIHFQGKRLQWSVKACAPNPNQPVIAGGVAESCSQSGPRILLWPLPVATLVEPRNGTVLETLRPLFRWDYDHLNGVDHFLLCLSKPGIACPTQPATTDNTIVVQVPLTPDQSQRSYIPSNDWTLLRNGPLHWTVAVCNRTFGCAYQQSVRQLSLARPSAPNLISPGSTVVLGLTNYYSNGNPRSEHPVSFGWQSVPKAVLYRICLAPVGETCGPPPGPTPETEGSMYRAGETQGTNLTLQLPNDLWWDYERGIRLQWTVSACNSVGMCTSSAPRPIQFQVSIHSFSNLYPTFQNSTCTNCHGMANQNSKYQQHVSEGRFPAGTNPANSHTCANCHTAARGFADGWKAPPANIDFTGKTFSETCSMIRHGATYTQKGMKHHLLTDALVTWAVRHIPGNPVANIALWILRVTNWLHKANQYEHSGGRPKPYPVLLRFFTHWGIIARKTGKGIPAKENRSQYE